MHDENNLKIASWIAARLKGVIRPEEESALEEWMNESEEHRLCYERMIDPDYLAERLEEYEACSLEALKERMMPSIRKQGRSIRLMRRIRQIAAVLFLPLVVGGVVLYLNKNTETSSVPTILPGKECAILETADGRQVELIAGKALEQLKLTGAVVTNDSNCLSYRSSGSENPAYAEYNTIIIPRGGEYRLTLADGSRVWLNSDTRLRYPVHFVGEKREVYLEGEAYFEVSRSGKPFEVHGGGQSVRVLGTSFNVMAYREEAKVQTTLVSGSVQVSRDDLPYKTVLLTPGQQSVLNKDDGMLTTRTVNVNNYTAWKDKLFVFDEEDMGTMMRKLARWYDVEIVIETATLREKVFYGVIPKYEHISKILDMLKKTQDIDYSIQGKKIVIQQNR